MTDQKTQPKGNRIDASRDNPDTISESARRMAYQSPTLKIERLALITLGGSPGAGDSGDSTNFQPAG